MDARLKMLRKQLGLTQQELADRIGIKRNTIATYESGRNEPIDAVISLICREFHINELWLREGIGEMEEKLPGDNQFSWNMGKLMNTTNPTVMNMVNAIAETEPEKLEIIAEFMKKCLGL